MRLPEYPVQGEPLTAAWGRQLIDFLRSLTPRPSAEVKPQRHPNGTTWELAARQRHERAEAAATPFRLACTIDEETGLGLISCGMGVIWRETHTGEGLPFTPDCCFAVIDLLQISDYDWDGADQCAVFLTLEYETGAWVAHLRATDDFSWDEAGSDGSFTVAIPNGPIAEATHFFSWPLGLVASAGAITQWWRSDIIWTHPPAGALRIFGGSTSLLPKGWEVVTFSGENPLLKLVDSGASLNVAGTGAHTHTIGSTTIQPGSGAPVTVAVSPIAGAGDDPKHVGLCLIRAL
jgi:hypothetical protein